MSRHRRATLYQRSLQLLETSPGQPAGRRGPQYALSLDSLETLAIEVAPLTHIARDLPWRALLGLLIDDARLALEEVFGPGHDMLERDLIARTIKARYVRWFEPTFDPTMRQALDAWLKLDAEFAAADEALRRRARSA